jgi:hypothetical protein
MGKEPCQFLFTLHLKQHGPFCRGPPSQAHCVPQRAQLDNDGRPHTSRARRALVEIAIERRVRTPTFAAMLVPAVHQNSAFFKTRVRAFAKSTFRRFLLGFALARLPLDFALGYLRQGNMITD